MVSFRTKQEKLTADILAGRYRWAEPSMTPDDSVIWTQHFLPDLGGSIFLPPNTHERVVKKLAGCALRPGAWPFGGKRGTSGKATFDADLAIKRFRFINTPNLAGLPALRANVALHEGLGRTKSVIGPWRMSAVEQLGAFITQTEEGVSAWVSTWERGLEPKEGYNPKFGASLPSLEERRLVYNQAFEACGMRPSRIDTDDHVGNLIARRIDPSLITVAAAPHLELVKLDVETF